MRAGRTRASQECTAIAVAQVPPSDDLALSHCTLLDTLVDMTGETGDRYRAPLRYCEADRVNDRYRIEGNLGGGGYSVVYDAYDELLDERIALKIFAPNYGFDPVRRELHALRRLSHPNVVQLIDVGKIETEPPQWYMKLEIVRGRTLRAILDEEGPLPPQAVRTIGEQLLSALCAIHPNTRRIRQLSELTELAAEQYEELQSLQGMGLLHRDIKPENLIYTADESVVLIDFNLATPVGSAIETRSHTPEYSPPLLGLDRWEVHPDIYATAVTLFELMTGTRPDSGSEITPAGLEEGSLSPSGFAEFVNRGLRSDREGFSSAQDMLDVYQSLPWDELDKVPREPVRLDRPEALPEGPAGIRPGKVLVGKVVNLTNFGAFIDLGDVEGLIHVSQLSWSYVDKPSDVVSVGDMVRVKVLAADPDDLRISLSMKALQPDPWVEFAQQHRVGELLYGRVVSLVPYGAFILVAEGVQGLVHISQMSHQYVDLPDQVVTVGEQLWVKLIDIDFGRRRMALSIRQAAEGGVVTQDHAHIIESGSFEPRPDLT